MDKKAVGRGAIILIIVLLVLIAIFIVVLGIAIFGGNRETIAPGGNEVETPGTGSGSGTETPTQPTNDNSKKAPTEQQTNYIPDDHPGDEVNPNYGKCTPNWSSNAGAYQPQYSELAATQ